jgi:hypothetical protein
MGGSSPTPPTPNSQLVDIAMLGMQQKAGQDALARQNAMDIAMSSRPMEVRVPDIYGPQGALNQMGQLAAVNAYKSKELEKMTNPAGAAAREEIQKQAAAGLSPSYWQNTMQQWGKGVGL